MFKLALNAGHGINTAGKRCLKSIDPAETREWSLNSRICKKIEERLACYDGITILRTDDVTGNTDRSINERASAANSFGADLYLSIHHNAGINGGSGGGIMAFTYLKVDDITTAWQNAFYNSAVAHTGLAGNRVSPLGRQDLGECRITKMPAVLMECGFMDSTTDTPKILTEDFSNKIADALCEVIVAKSGAVKRVVTTPSVTVNNDILPYRVRKSWDNIKSQTGAFFILENAINTARKTKCNVYDGNKNCVWSYDEDNLPNKEQEESSEQKDNGIIELLNKILNILKKITGKK